MNLAPGSGIHTWTPGAEYLWEVNDADATPGADPGWDLINITGALRITATAANKFRIRVTSLTLANAAGNATDFNSANWFSWRIVSTTTGIQNFSRDVIDIDTTGFTNPLGSGSFVVDTSVDNRDLLLRFIPSLPSVFPNVVPTWVEQGPQGIASDGTTYSGAVHSIAVHPGKREVVFVGAVNGGVWRTNDITVPRPPRAIG